MGIHSMPSELCVPKCSTCHKNTEMCAHNLEYVGSYAKSHPPT